MTEGGADLREVLREWGRLGVIGFGGPLAHVALLRELCVERRRWLDAEEFEDANAACQLLPGPASTQLAIYCAHRVAGLPGALVGGLAFILPGLVMLIALAALTLGSSPPRWALGLAAGAGAAILAVILRVGIDLAQASLAPRSGLRRLRAIAYLALGAATVVFAGPGVVLALLACGAVETLIRRGMPSSLPSVALPQAAALLAAASAGVAALPALAWTALKVGALSYGGGFVIVPIMQGDAVDLHHWMTDTQFLNAVALGQITPGPVVQTVAAVGWAAAGLGGALLAAAIAFAPSFLVIAIGGARFHALRENATARAFLDGAGPAAIGAILGTVVPLASGVSEGWQWGVAAIAAVLLLAARRSVVPVLLAAGAAGIIAGVTQLPLP
ncbi:unannotated protein [freshwater metagenome]|uniref:Unannotated protein n=1 Tax=freshwater metagenome TaxID=449393 RepID=A0A6J7CY51_9ZZZZ|nr:chromate efflux transporter [Actinomycetota bacterium]